MKPILLSGPDVRGPELRCVHEAIESNWIAPAGPDLEAFEAEIAEIAGCRFGVGLSSGTAAIQLGLVACGVGPGDEVITSTFTFAATANAIHHTGATPIFIDSERASWNLDPGLLDEFLDSRRKQGRLPKACVPVDLYGQPCNYSEIRRICGEYDVLIVEDAAEALGAKYGGAPCGSFGRAAALSFNGNKTISTSGGGMLVTDDPALADRARHLATQAREIAPHYQHIDRGYNFRLSNLLAAFGRGQLVDFEARVSRRRQINDYYRRALADVEAVSFMPEAPASFSTFWLTAITLDERITGATREDLRLALESESIESRPLWKPMHRQPAYASEEHVVNGVSDSLFAVGLCLPSGSGLEDADLDRVVAVARKVLDT